MNKYLFTLILIISNLTNAQVKQNDGYWWNGLDKTEMNNPELSKLFARGMKIGYVTGVVDQAITDELRMTLVYGEDSSYNSQFWFKIFQNIFNRYYNITFGQFVEGVSEFYKDYRNLQIIIPDAMYIIAMQVKGEPDEEIEAYLRDIRSGGGVLHKVYEMIATDAIKQLEIFEQELSSFRDIKEWKNSWPIQMSLWEIAIRQQLYDSKQKPDTEKF